MFHVASRVVPVASLVGWLAAVTLAAQLPAPQPSPGTPRPPGGIPGMPRRDVAPAPDTPATAIVRGHVVAADTGQGLRRASVRLSAPELRQGRVALTDAVRGHRVPGRFREVCFTPSRRLSSAKPDQQGLYRIERLPPGEYHAIALPEVDDEMRFRSPVLGAPSSARDGVHDRGRPGEDAALKLVAALP